MNTQLTKKVFIASSSEMHHERLVLVDLLTDMSTEEVYYQPVKWEYIDPAMSKKRKENIYLDYLCGCDVCITLFWKTLGEYTREELEVSLMEQAKGCNPKNILVLIKNDGSKIDSNLNDFLVDLKHQHGDIVEYFADDVELSNKVNHYLSKIGNNEDVRNNQLSQEIKEINIMVAASNELEEDQLEFTDMVASLNMILPSSIGCRMHRVKWKSGNIADFPDGLNNCEWCLDLYWQQLPNGSIDRVSRTVGAFQLGNNPQHFYVFFKEPCKNITKALKEFKTSFEKEYNDFFCRYMNVDGIRSEFLMRFFEFCIKNFGLFVKSLLKVKNGYWVFGDSKMGEISLANLANRPEVALNEEYDRLHQELMDLDVRIAELRNRYKANLDDENVEDELIALKLKRKELSDNLDRHISCIFEMTLQFLKHTENRYSDIMNKAKELSMQGKISEANDLFDPQMIMEDDAKEKEMEEQVIKNRKSRIKVLLLSAYTAIVISDYDKAWKCFDNAISILGEIKSEETGDRLIEYAFLLHEHNEYEKAIERYDEALHYPISQMDFAFASHQKGSAERELALNPSLLLKGRPEGLDVDKESLWIENQRKTLYDAAETDLTRALKLYDKLETECPICTTFKIILVNDFGLLKIDREQYDEAIHFFIYALEHLDKCDNNINNDLDKLVILYNIVRCNLNSKSEKLKTDAIRLAESVIVNAIPTYDDCRNSIGYLSYGQLENFRYIMEGCKNVLDMRNHFDEMSEKTFKRLDSIYKILIDTFDSSYIQQRFYNLWNLSWCYLKAERYEDALNNYIMAVPLVDLLIDKEQDVYKEEKVRLLGNMSYCAIMLKRFDEAEKYAEDSLEIDTGHLNSYTNLAHALLFQGKIQQAEKIYIEYKDELKEASLEDFDQFEKDGIIPDEYRQDVERIKLLLI